jgi:hypothetical protein
MQCTNKIFALRLCCIHTIRILALIKTDLKSKPCALLCEMYCIVHKLADWKDWYSLPCFFVGKELKSLRSFYCVLLLLFHNTYTHYLRSFYFWLHTLLSKKWIIHWRLQNQCFDPNFFRSNPCRVLKIQISFAKIAKSS